MLRLQIELPFHIFHNLELFSFSPFRNWKNCRVNVFVHYNKKSVNRKLQLFKFFPGHFSLEYIEVLGQQLTIWHRARQKGSKLHSLVKFSWLSSAETGVFPMGRCPGTMCCEIVGWGFDVLFGLGWRPALTSTGFEDSVSMCRRNSWRRWLISRFWLCPAEGSTHVRCGSGKSDFGVLFSLFLVGCWFDSLLLHRPWKGHGKVWTMN